MATLYVGVGGLLGVLTRRLHHLLDVLGAVRDESDAGETGIAALGRRLSAYS
jgi:hypothetical protein